MPNIEAITVLAVVEAQDKASALLSGIFSSLTKTADAFRAAGDAAQMSGRLMDAGLMSGATAAERLTIAEGELAGAQDAAWASSQRLREAQITLAEAIEVEGAKSKAAAAAQADLREATLANTIATGNLRDAQLVHGAAQAEVTAHANGLKMALEGTLSTMTKIGGATALVSGYSVKLAGDFQQETQTLVAGAGVQQDKIEGVRKSILQMATDTGTSTKALSDSFFQVNSRLGDVGRSTEVVNDAAELAKVHMADLNTVSIALASSMNAYSHAGLTAGQASNILGVVVEKGGMSFQDLAGSLSTVLPKAQEAGISFAQVTAAVATMTRSGQTAAAATTDLAHTIGKLQSPTHEMLSTWNQMGLTQKQVADALHGPGGLQAAMNLISDTAKSKLGPSGEVVIKTFKDSQDATHSLTQMLQNMDPAAKSLAVQLQNGTIGARDYTKAAKELSEASSVQALQFKSLYDRSNGFNDALKSGKPGFSDFSALLKSSYGDATSMQTALLLGGDAAQKWADITKEATAAGSESANGIRGWAALQDTLNQKMAQAKEQFQVAAITLGTALLPPVIKLVQTITPWLQGLAQLIKNHQEATKLVIGFGLALGVVGIALKTVIGFFTLFKDAFMIVKSISTAIKEYEVAVKLVSAATKIWTGIQAAFDAVMAANPIVLVVIAIMALVAAAVYAFYHFKGFHDFIIASWQMIKTSGIALWHVLEGAFRGISDAAKTVWNFLVGVFNGIVNAVTSFGATVWHGITSVWDSIANFFKKWWPLLIVIFAFPIAVLISIWNHFHEEITGTAKAVWNGLADFFKWVWDNLSSAAQAAWNLIKEYIVTPIRLAWNELMSVLSAVGDFLSSAWDGISSLAHSAWVKVYNYIITPLLLAWDQIKGWMNSVGSVISDGFNYILNLLSGVNRWFGEIGLDIVRGMVDGVKAGWHLLTDAVKNLAEDALKGAKSFLGISSPSKLFANEIGQHIPGGVAKGINDHTQTAVDAVTQMAGALPAAIGVKGAVNLGVNGINSAGTVLATGLGVGATGGGGGGGDTHVHIDLRDAVVAGDRGIEDLTNRIGSVFARRGLPQAGVRMHN